MLYYDRIDAFEDIDLIRQVGLKSVLFFSIVIHTKALGFNHRSVKAFMTY